MASKLRELETELAKLRRREQNREAQRRFRAKNKPSGTSQKQAVQQSRSTQRRLGNNSVQEMAMNESFSLQSYMPPFPGLQTPLSSSEFLPGQFECLVDFDGTTATQGQHSRSQGAQRPMVAQESFAWSEKALAQEDSVDQENVTLSKDSGLNQRADKANRGRTRSQCEILSTEAVRLSNQLLSLYRTGNLLNIIPRNQDLECYIRRVRQSFQHMNEQADELLNVAASPRGSSVRGAKEDVEPEPIRFDGKPEVRDMTWHKESYRSESD